jgi:hypothetical protein
MHALASPRFPAGVFGTPGFPAGKLGERRITFCGVSLALRFPAGIPAGYPGKWCSSFTDLAVFVVCMHDSRSAGAEYEMSTTIRCVHSIADTLTAAAWSVCLQMGKGNNGRYVDPACAKNACYSYTRVFAVIIRRQSHQSVVIGSQS